MSVVSQTTLNFSWGPSPATAAITLPGDCRSDYPLDSAIVLTVESVTWRGIVRAAPKRVQGHGGWFTVIDAVDSRVKWERENVYCLFNQPEVRDDNLATPGIDRQRRYKCIVPDGWRTQTAVWHDAPLTARQVLGYLCDDVGGWDFEDHSGLDKPLGVFDANNGMAFSEALGRIAEECGLMVGLADADTIRFAVKGVGTVPSFPTYSGSREVGSQLSGNPTHWSIVGDRAKYQVNNITLDPGWNRWWEDYVMKADFWDLVDTWFGPFDDDDAGQSSLSAKALSVTVRELSETIDDDTILDSRSWGDVSRNDIPALVYVQDIVFKAYQLPADFTIEPLWLPAALTLDSLELSDGGLNCNVDFDVDTGEMALPGSADRRFFPNASATVIVKGLDMSAFDPMARKHLTTAQLAEAGSKWKAVYDFNLDVRTDGRCVVFSTQMFASGDLIRFPNHGVLPSTHPLYDLAVVNAAPTLAPADVKASLMFFGERYRSTYGSGSRKGVKYYSGLSEMWVFEDSGIVGLEVPSGKNDSGGDVFADDLADQFGANLLVMPDVYSGGSWSRSGSTGTTLSGVVHGVSVKVARDAGIVEDVTFADDRVSGGIFPARFLEWNRRSRDLFPRQEELRQQAWTAKTLASMRTMQRKIAAPVASVQDLAEVTFGNQNPSASAVQLSSTEAAGSVMFQKNGVIDASGTELAGVVIADGSSGQSALATQGVVPVKVKGPFTAGSTVGVRDGESYARIIPDGHKTIGRVLHDYSGTATILAYVELGATDSARKPSKLGPWNSYVSSIEETDGVATKVNVKLNPDSTFLKSSKLSDMADFSEEFGTEYGLQYGHCFWMELNFGSDGVFSSVQLKHGVPASNGWTDFATTKPTYKFLGSYPDDKSQTAWVMLASIDEAGENDPVVATFGSGPATLRNYWRGGDMMLARFCAMPDEGGEKIGYVKPFLRGYRGIY
jgi:hypothetical protein